MKGPEKAPQCERGLSSGATACARCTVYLPLANQPAVSIVKQTAGSVRKGWAVGQISTHAGSTG